MRMFKENNISYACWSLCNKSDSCCFLTIKDECSWNEVCEADRDGCMTCSVLVNIRDWHADQHCTDSLQVLPQFSAVWTYFLVFLQLLLFSPIVWSDSLRSHELYHTRHPCPSLSPGVCSNTCPLSQWCRQTISSSVTRFSSCRQSFLSIGVLSSESALCIRWLKSCSFSSSNLFWWSDWLRN